MMARYSNPVAAMTAEYARSCRAARVTRASTIVVTTHAIQNHPNMPPQPSSIVPVSTDPIPVGSSMTAVSIGLLYLLIERTRIGIAFRAVSAHPFASRVCGLNLRRVHLFSWVVAGLLGVVASLLIVPTTFLSSTSVAAFMLQAFAAAVVGGFSSLPGAVLGGIFIGVLMNLLSFYVAAEFNNTYLLLTILLVLNVFPKGVIAVRGSARA